MRFDKGIIDSTGLFLSCCRTATERGYGTQDRGQFEHAGYVFGVTGAVAFYQRKMLEEIALESDYFDSDFHIFFEDLDISWRAHLCGWKGYYMPHARAYHLRGGTVRKSTGLNKNYARRYLSDQLHFYLIKNRYLTIIKNESLSGFLLHVPCLLFYEIASWMYILLFSRCVLRKFFTEPVNWKAAWRKRELCKRKYG